MADRADPPGDFADRTAAVQSFYGRFARLYDLVATHTPGIGRLRGRVADALTLEPGDAVVEVGCGSGANLPFLRDRVGPEGRVIGVDLTPGMLERARRRVARAGWDNVHLVRGDAARPPVAAADAVLATFVVGLLDDPAGAVARWCDVAPRGRIALLDATRSPRRVARPLDAAYRAFVALSAPPATRLRYRESPAAVLDRRVAAAREALADRAALDVDERHALGFVRLTRGMVRGGR